MDDNTATVLIVGIICGLPVLCVFTYSLVRLIVGNRRPR